MRTDLDRLGALIGAGAAVGKFRVDTPEAAAKRIITLIDGMSIQAANPKT